MTAGPWNEKRKMMNHTRVRLALVVLEVVGFPRSAWTGTNVKGIKWLVEGIKGA